MVTNLCYFFYKWKKKFKITETKLYVPVVTLPAQDKAKLLQQLKSGFKRRINWNKYESNLIKPSFQGANRLFVLSFENKDDRTSHSTYYLPKLEIKDYNVMIDCKNFFYQPRNSKTKTYENIRKIATGQGDDYATGCLLDYSYFKDHYKIIPIDLSKQQALDAGPRAIQKIDFTTNLDRDGYTTMFVITEEAKETVLGFSQGTVRVLQIQFR